MCITYIYRLQFPDRMRHLLLLVFLLSGSQFLHAQTGLYFNCNKDTLISCTVPCFTLKTKIPDVKSSSAVYRVNPIDPGGCRLPVSPEAPGISTNLTIDDRYSSVIDIG